MAETYI